MAVAVAAVEHWTELDTAAASERTSAFKWKRPCEIPHLSDSPPTPAVLLESPSQVFHECAEGGAAGSGESDGIKGQVSCGAVDGGKVGRHKPTAERYRVCIYHLSFMATIEYTVSLVNG
jgi:hypothetical protein